MKRFTQLYLEVERTTRTSEKADALRRYFDNAPDQDAAWALAVLTGRRPVRAAPTKRLRAWAADAAGLPAWLVDECYSAVGDLSETLALLLPAPDPDRAAQGEAEPLHQVMQERLVPLAHMHEAQQRASVEDTWASRGPMQRFVFHKLMGGAFRFGAAKKVVANALAASAGVDPAVMQHRLAGDFQPTADAYRALRQGDAADPARPYPFYLAHPLEDDPAERLEDPAHWLAEWKWDGIRAQLLRREGRCVLWSRGDEVVTGAFPEISAAAADLPDGLVLDGEILAWDHQAAADTPDASSAASAGGALRNSGVPLPFASLQKRLNRKDVQPALFPDVPVAFMAYDILERDGQDLRPQPTQARRDQLEAGSEHFDHQTIRLSPRITFSNWQELAELRQESRKRGVEGVMLKRLDAPYGVGRTDKGRWWKWKVDPFTIDAVMVAAQRGHGRRASLFTDYTFALWTGPERGQGELTPIAKAYSGLTDAEFVEVDRFIQKNTVGKKGAYRGVAPELVFELAFEAVRESSRHKSGLAVRFPRMARWRKDKRPEDADTLSALRALQPNNPAQQGGPA
ncbi:MAG: ATP-dependent DNA ligase [Planctomycetota bacterium]